MFDFIKLLIHWNLRVYEQLMDKSRPKNYPNTQEQDRAAYLYKYTHISGQMCYELGAQSVETKVSF